MHMAPQARSPCACTCVACVGRCPRHLQAVQKMRNNSNETGLLMCGAPICVDNVTTVSEV